MTSLEHALAERTESPSGSGPPTLRTGAPATSNGLRVDDAGVTRSQKLVVCLSKQAAAGKSYDAHDAARLAELVVEHAGCTHGEIVGPRLAPEVVQRANRLWIRFIRDEELEATEVSYLVASVVEAHDRVRADPIRADLLRHDDDQAG